MNNRLHTLTRLGLLALAALPAATAQAQTATAVTNPVGYLQTTCLGNSDTLVALPFTRMPAFTGAVASVSGSTVSIANTPGFTANQFVQNLAASPAQTDTFYLTVGPATTSLASTVTVTENSPTVTAGTAGGFSVLTVGDRLTVNDGYNQLAYTVAAISADSNTLTLDRPFVDAAAGSTSAVTAPPTGTATTGTLFQKPTAVKTSKPTTRRRVNVPTGVVTVPTAVVKPIANTPSTLTGLAATFDHSPLEGRWYLVSANDAGSVTVTLNGDSLSNLAAGTQVSVVPCWTLNTLLPNGGGVTATTNFRSLNTQLLIPNYGATGTDLSAATTYYFISNGSNVGWRSFAGGPNADHGNDYLLPDGYITVRQDNGSPTVALTFNGSVPTNKLVTPLATSASQFQDNAVGLNRPADVALNSLGLTPTDASFQATTNFRQIQDQILVYDNTAIAKDKSATTTYYYINNGANVGWRSFVTGPNVDHGSDLIPAGSALTIRKAPMASGQTVQWNNSPNY